MCRVCVPSPTLSCSSCGFNIEGQPASVHGDEFGPGRDLHAYGGGGQVSDVEVDADGHLAGFDQTGSTRWRAASSMRPIMTGVASTSTPRLPLPRWLAVCWACNHQGGLAHEAGLKFGHTILP